MRQGRSCEAGDVAWQSTQIGRQSTGHSNCDGVVGLGKGHRWPRTPQPAHVQSVTPILLCFPVTAYEEKKNHGSW